MYNVRIVVASMYLDINQHLGDNLLNIDDKIKQAKREGIIIAMDSK